MTLKNEAKCMAIADHYGFPVQREMLTEECAELIQAVQKLKRAECCNAEKEGSEIRHYIEELADVSIMIEQMLHYLTPELKNFFDLVIIGKLDRQFDRISKEKEDYQKWRNGVKV